MIISKNIGLCLLLLVLSFIGNAQTNKLSEPIVSDKLVFEEKNGAVAVEAEHFYKQTHSEIRQWYRISKNEVAKVGRDEDVNHYSGASNHSYIEILPDTRVTHSDKLVRGENFSNEPGKIAVLNYRVKFKTPGRYYVWVRAMSTGTEDNGIHVGLNGNWPEHGQRMQWCEGKNQWTWASKQRTKEEHCGVPHGIYLDINDTGIHDVQFSMREDGFEFDKFILTTDIDFVPTDKGPNVTIAQGHLPESDKPKTELSYFNTITKARPENKWMASQEFAIEGTHFYKNGKNWLAINPEKYKQARTHKTFDFESGRYDVIFVGVGENDGRSQFRVFINNKELGTYRPPLTDKLWEEGKRFNGFWKKVKLSKGDKITVEAHVATDGNEWTRGRWAGIVFTPAGKGEIVQEATSTSTFEK